jgi:hypothetical protein
VITLRRLLAASAAAVAAVAVLPAPAHAAPAPFTFSVHNLGVTPAGKFTRLDLRALPGAPAQIAKVEVVIDATEIAEFATAWVPNFTGDGDPVPSPDCAVAGAVTTCSWASRSAWIGWLPNLVVQAKEGAEIGRSGKLAISFVAEGFDKLTTTPTITVVDDIDLAAGPAGQKATTKPDARVEAPVEIRNTGTKPVDGVVARFTGETAGLRLDGRYTNCVYRPAGDEAWCRFDQVLAPGTTYRVGAPVFRTLVEPEGDDQFSYVHLWLTADDVDESGGSVFTDGVLTPGIQGVLGLEPVVSTLATDANGANNLAFGFVTIDKSTTPPSPSPSVTSPSPSASSSSPAVAAPAGQGGGLPITGANTPIVVGTGVLLVLIGVVALRFSRRRA